MNGMPNWDTMQLRAVLLASRTTTQEDVDEETYRHDRDDFSPTDQWENCLEGHL